MGKGLVQNRITADGSITGATEFTGWLRKIIITTDITGAGEVLIYDDAATATGTVIFRVQTAHSGDATFGISTTWDFPGAGVLFEKGMYADISGGTAAVQAYWDR
jgi:hypothetical protein